MTETLTSGTSLRLRGSVSNSAMPRLSSSADDAPYAERPRLATAKMPCRARRETLPTRLMLGKGSVRGFCCGCDAGTLAAVHAMLRGTKRHER